MNDGASKLILKKRVNEQNVRPLSWLQHLQSRDHLSRHCHPCSCGLWCATCIIIITHRLPDHSPSFPHDLPSTIVTSIVVIIIVITTRTPLNIVVAIVIVNIAIFTASTTVASFHVSIVIFQLFTGTSRSGSASRRPIVLLLLRVAAALKVLKQGRRGGWRSRTGPSGPSGFRRF